MPIYEYACSACEHEFEQIQKFSDPPVTDCPSCVAEGTVTRKLSASAFVLNGSGWYSDGYSAKNRKNGKASQGESKSESASESGSETKAVACGTGACENCAA
jgi:putative FmdB family regulatory protein